MNVVLVMYRDNGERRSFSLTRDVTVIGRREDADFRIPLSDVSRKHSRLIKDGNQLIVEDLGSANGTWHNGARVQEAEIQPGDNLQIGPVRFVVQIDGVPDEAELAHEAGANGATSISSSGHRPIASGVATMTASDAVLDSPVDELTQDDIIDDAVDNIDEINHDEIEDDSTDQQSTDDIIDDYVAVPEPVVAQDDLANDMNGVLPSDSAAEMLTEGAAVSFDTRPSQRPSRPMTPLPAAVVPDAETDGEPEAEPENVEAGSPEPVAGLDDIIFEDINSDSSAEAIDDILIDFNLPEKTKSK